MHLQMDFAYMNFSTWADCSFSKRLIVQVKMKNSSSFIEVLPMLHEINRNRRQNRIKRRIRNHRFTLT